VARGMEAKLPDVHHKKIQASEKKVESTIRGRNMNAAKHVIVQNTDFSAILF